MIKLPPRFEIHESRTEGSVRLTVSGELDIATAPVLEERLAPLRASRSAVSLDISSVEFIDSSGLHLLIRMASDAGKTAWGFHIEPNVAPNVMRLLKVTRQDRLVSRGREE